MTIYTGSPYTNERGAYRSGGMFIAATWPNGRMERDDLLDGERRAPIQRSPVLHPPRYMPLPKPRRDIVAAILAGRIWELDAPTPLSDLMAAEKYIRENPVSTK